MHLLLEEGLSSILGQVICGFFQPSLQNLQGCISPNLSGHLLQWCLALVVKQIFLMFNLNVHSHALWLLPLVMSLYTTKGIWLHRPSRSFRLLLCPPSASPHAVHDPAPGHLGSTSLDLLQFLLIYLEPERPKTRYSVPVAAPPVPRRGVQCLPLICWPRYSKSGSAYSLPSLQFWLIFTPK